MKRKQREPIVLAQMRPITLFLVLSGCVAVVFAFMNFSSVAALMSKILTAIGPVITGGVFAYLLNPAVTLLERRLRRLLKKSISKHPKLESFPRVTASLIAMLLLIGSVTLLLIATFSQIVNGISTFLEKMPDYVNNVKTWTETLLRNNPEIASYLELAAKQFTENLFGSGQIDAAALTQNILSAVATGAAGTFSIVYNVLVGIIIAIYLLISKDRFLRQWKKILYSIAPPRVARRIDEEILNANELFGTAIVGKAIDSVIIGMICFMGNTVLGLPYATLIAVIIGITNMIPYFGPIFGAVPCALLVLMENPLKALYFVIFALVLQQFDCNWLDPKIVGNSLGLPAFWELFACMIGGGLFGIWGLMLGVPIFALIYRVIRRFAVDRLRTRALRGELAPEFLNDELGVNEPLGDLDTLADAEAEEIDENRVIQLNELSESVSSEDSQT